MQIYICMKSPDTECITWCIYGSVYWCKLMM